ncbi:electron transfer flavoprotein subunit alpha/FixB family protein [Patulibacter defluvii]|uniref:electron transfer flavoprotein subunit alpha/FixB family protein n=1 Tax=Patulibacter defluvii TaxID=3095358 RepID=UPI002A76360B|nr:FAD-binding protein [Patulibacter sp. DM4]
MSGPLVAIAADGAAAAGEVLPALAADWSPAALTAILAHDDGDHRGLGVGRVLLADGLDLDGPVGAAGEALLELTRDARVVLLADRPAHRDLAGWLAVRLGGQLAWAVERIVPEADGVGLRRVVNGGADRLLDRRPDGHGPLIALVRAGAAADAAEPEAVVPAAVVERRTVRSGLAPAATAPTRTRHAPASAPMGPPPLRGRRVVVAVGRGIGGPENVDRFRRLAAALDAGLGATRAVVDAGWLPFEHQIGQTGATVAPDLYLAFGVSGAVQHLVGMRDSRTVVAVNHDPDADLCRVADVVVAADANAVADALLQHLEPEGKPRA